MFLALLSHHAFLVIFAIQSDVEILINTSRVLRALAQLDRNNKETHGDIKMKEDDCHFSHLYFAFQLVGCFQFVLLRIKSEDSWDSTTGIYYSTLNNLMFVFKKLK